MIYEVEFTFVDGSVDTLLITEQVLEQIKKTAFTGGTWEFTSKECPLTIYNTAHVVKIAAKPLEE